MKALFAQGIIAAALTAIAIAPGAGAPVGRYYTVAAEALCNFPVKTNGCELATTASIALFHKDDGTTVIRAVFQKRTGSTAYRLNAEDMPPEIRYAFNGRNEITSYADQSGVPNGEPQFFAKDLLAEDGLPEGNRLKLVDAAGQPARSIRAEFINAPGERPGEVAIYAGGVMILPPQSPENMNATLRITDERTSMAIEFASHMLHTVDLHLPLLNDWDTTTPQVDVVYGTIYNENDQPAQGLKFQCRYYHASFQAPLTFVSGDGGAFRLALPKESSNLFGNFTFMPTHRLAIKYGNEEESYALVPDMETRVRPREKTTLKITLLDAGGKPLPVDAGTTWGLGALRSDREDTFPLLPDPLTSGQLVAADVPVPGYYIAQSGSDLFEAKYIDRGATHATFRVDNIPFCVKGRIVDIAGRPVTDTSFTVNWYYTIVEQGRGLRAPSFRPRSISALAQPDGTFTLEGINGQPRDVLFVQGKDYGPISLNPLIRHPGLVRKDGRLWASGDYDDITVPTARVATATLTLKDDAWGTPTTRARAIPPPNSGNIIAEVQCEALQSLVPRLDNATSSPRYVVRWNVPPPFLEKDRIEIAVPAETTFTITIRKPLHAGQRDLTVNSPLKPGEIRDFTDELSPAREPQPRYRF